jgi:S1-C subfamily serine protease
MKKYYCAIVIVFCSLNIFANPDYNFQNVLPNIKKAIVTISVRESLSPFRSGGNYTGTGFVHDQKNGLIITNQHIASGDKIATYFITFHNGKEAEAKLLYYDAWQDFSILKVPVEDLPKDITSINFSNDPAYENQSVFIVGNNEARDFSVHNGNLSNIYDINGQLPQRSYIVNLNSVGGSSGSPLLNEKGEAIGIHYAGSQTYGISLDANYIKRSLSFLQSGKTPKRNHIGVIAGLYSLDRAVRYRNFPKKIMEKYLEHFPEARNRVIIVNSTIEGSPAADILQNGDILWKVNDQQIASDLQKFDELMDKSSGKIKVEFVRNGQFIKKEIELYDINKYKIGKFIEFAGAYFFNCTDYCSALSGIKHGSIVVAYIRPGSSFSVINTALYHGNSLTYRISPIKINGFEIKELSDVILASETAIKKREIEFEYNNYHAYVENFNEALNTAHRRFIFDIDLGIIDNQPKIFEYDYNMMEWKESNSNYITK